MANWTNNNPTYYINPAHLTFVENSGYGPNFIQVSASSSCYISVYDPANGINFSDADKNYCRWKVTAYNNKFPNEKPEDRGMWIIYVRMEHRGTSALIVYSLREIGIHGGEIIEKTDESGNVVKVEGEYDQENFPYYYIRIGEVGPTNGTSIREITYDTGYLTSDKGKEDSNALNDMWELDKYSTPWLIKAKQWLADFTVKGFVKLVGGLKFSKGKEGDEKVITDIKRSTDSGGEFMVDEEGNSTPNPDYVPVSDETLATSAWVDSKMKNEYLRKDKDDTAKGIITFEKGIKSKDFVQGNLIGAGWSIYKDANGNTVVETDTIIARKGINASELIINQETFQKGSTIYVKGGCAITKVEEIDGVYRCYYDNEGGKRFSGFVVGDQARCQRYDSSYGLKIKYYWRLIVGVADDYVDLSITDFDGDGVPEAGDDIAQLGNRADKTRQSAIVISPDNGGSVVVWAGIDSYNLSERNMCGMGVNPNNGRAYIYGYGDMFFGDRNLEKNFITYQIKDGDTEPTLTINADVHFSKDSTGLGNLTEFEEIKTNVDYLNNQIEREFTIWYFNDEPTLENEPAVNWVTDELKAMHDQDLYFSDALSRAWRFVSGVWEEITDERTLSALKIAEDAEKSADEKRRVFVKTPTPPYDEGDLWVQGESGDIMRCLNPKKEKEEFSEEDWVKASKYTDDSELKKFIDGDYKKQVEEIKSQIDARAESWYQEVDPSLSWETEEDKALHIGDLWYDPSRKQSFMWNGSEWISQGVPEEVFDKIDGKAAIFVSRPSSYRRNDIWILSEDTTLDRDYKAGTIVVATNTSDTFSKTHWTKKDNYTDDTLAEEAFEKAKEALEHSESFSEELEGVKIDMELVMSQVDREFTIWYYDHVPTLYNEPAVNWNTQDLIDMHDQDIYFSDSLARAWRFVNGAWVEITDERTLAALKKVDDLEYIKDAFGNKENILSGGVVMGKVVGVIDENENVVAFLNGGEFAENSEHGKLMLAGGIPSGATGLEDRARNATTRLYENGYLITKSADIEGTIRVGTMVHKTLYGDGGDLTGYSMAVGIQGVTSSFLLPEITDEDFIEVKVVWFGLSRLATAYYVMAKDGRRINYKSGGEFVQTTALNIKEDTFYKFFSVRGEWYVSTEPIYSV